MFVCWLQALQLYLYFCYILTVFVFLLLCTMCVLTGEHFSHFPFLRSLTRLSNRDPPLSAVYDDDDGDDGDCDGDDGGDDDDDDSLTRLSNPVYDDRGVTTEMMMVIGCWHLWHFREARDKSALSSWPPTWFKPILKKNSLMISSPFILPRMPIHRDGFMLEDN